jgi:capsular exopolysaccharide synthesis family protein
METSNFQTEEQNELSIVEVFFHYLRYWKYFILSVVICMCVAYAYLFFATPQYRVFSRVIIIDQKKSQTSDMSSAFSDIGIAPPKNNMDNEIEILRSQTLTKSVVDSLRLGVSYFKNGRIRNREIYKQTPVLVAIPKIMASGSFTVDSVSEHTFSIRSNHPKFDQTVELGKDVASPWGTLNLTKNPFGKNGLYPVEVFVNSSYLPTVDVSSVNKTSTVVELSVITPTPQKGQDIINTLVAIYNKNAIDDQNYVANSTIRFIDERLGAVSGELQDAEQKVTSYNITQGITDLQAQGQLLLSSSSAFNKQITDAKIQTELLKSIQGFVMDPANKDKVIPSNVGISDPTVIALIQKYNDGVLGRDKATGSMEAAHPGRIAYNNQVATLRDDMMKGIDISEAGLQSTIREWQFQDNASMSKARNMNTQERESRDLGRQQNIKETLYIYLLQKMEDTRLSKMLATPNAKVIDAAAFSYLPVQPKKMIILLAALVMALIIPVVVIYIRDLFDNKIHTKEDITRVISAPFLGFIPVMKGTDPFPASKVRSSMAERFRTVISNLSFIVGSERRKIISVTSFVSGEGKSFFSRNLAMTLATSGKKTLLIDLDLRKSILVKTLGLSGIDKGSAMFLSDPKLKISDIIDRSHSFHEKLDIIPVHVFPPNPAELLSSERLEELFQGIGREYEYVVVDTAPVGLVADVYNINRYALATIFLLRSDYTLKKQLQELQEFYRDKKLNNISVVLNAVSDDNIYGYGKSGYYSNSKHNYYTDEN